MQDIVKYCLEENCSGQASMQGYCRLHYIKNWKLIQFQKRLKSEHKLNSYVEQMVDKYPEGYVKAIREDLASDSDLLELIAETQGQTTEEPDVDEDTKEVLEEIKKRLK